MVEAEEPQHKKLGDILLVSLDKTPLRSVLNVLLDANARHIRALTTQACAMQSWRV